MSSDQTKTTAVILTGRRSVSSPAQQSWHHLNMLCQDILGPWNIYVTEGYGIYFLKTKHYPNKTSDWMSEFST